MCKNLNVTKPLSYECFLLIQLEILNYNNIRYLKFKCVLLFLPLGMFQIIIFNRRMVGIETLKRTIGL